MPIVRTFACPECNHYLELTLPIDQWDSPPPVCPECSRRQPAQPMQQEFKPVAIGGSLRAKAVEIAETIAREDYHVADMQSDRRVGGKPKVRYRDAKVATKSDWTVAQGALATAISLGRETRLKHGGNGLDILQRGLADGSIPDMIANSKKLSAKIW